MNDDAGSPMSFLAVVCVFALLCLIAVSYGIRRSRLGDGWKAWWGRRRHNRILIIVEQPFEATAMRAATADQRRGQWRGWRRRRRGTEYLATYSRARLYLMTAGPGDTLQIAARSLSRVRPDLVILVGVCRGLHPERQGVGDLVLGSVLAHVETDPDTSTGTLRLDPDLEEAYYLLLARLRIQDHVRVEGFILCHGDLPQSWTLAEDLAKLDPRAVAASSDRSRVYAAAARLDPHCTGWAAIRAVAWYGQYRTSVNDQAAASSVAELIVATAKSTALNYR